MRRPSVSMIFRGKDEAPKVVSREDNPDFGEFFKILKDPRSKVFLKYSKKITEIKTEDVDEDDPQFENFLAFCDGWDTEANSRT